MRKLLLAVSVLVFIANADTASATTRTAHAARVAHLKARVAAAMPSAQNQVAAAAASGPAALGALLQRTENMPMPAPNTTSPEQYAILVALQPYVTTTDSLTPAGIGAGMSSCFHTYGPIGDHRDYYVGPVHVGWQEKDHGYWCGNGSSIYDVGGGNYGYYNATWSGLGYCQVTVFDRNGWDVPYSWLHAKRTTHLGNYTPWTSCVTFTGGSTSLRLAANGYWDTYDDIY